MHAPLQQLACPWAAGPAAAAPTGQSSIHGRVRVMRAPLRHTCAAAAWSRAACSCCLCRRASSAAAACSHTCACAVATSSWRSSCRQDIASGSCRQSRHTCSRHLEVLSAATKPAKPPPCPAFLLHMDTGTTTAAASPFQHELTSLLQCCLCQMAISSLASCKAAAPGALMPGLSCAPASSGR